ncbi:MAG: hypothetical protein EOO88_26045 [Pedobacter sp.]|nr:MAG: hypothetical protein EOO88_26045 [Pedobacter sp.]
MKKNVRFKYDLLRAEPEDSIYVQLETTDNTFFPKAVQGDIGTNLTPGYDKLFFWDPLADHRKLNETVKVSFVIRTFSVNDSLGPKVRGFVLTKRRVIDYSRWAVSAALTGISVNKGITLLRAIEDYKVAVDPTSADQKNKLDQQQQAFEVQKRQLYTWVTASAVSVLLNAVYSLARPKPRQALQQLSLQGQGSSISLAYTF